MSIISQLPIFYPTGLAKCPHCNSRKNTLVKERCARVNTKPTWMGGFVTQFEDEIYCKACEKSFYAVSMKHMYHP